MIGQASVKNKGKMSRSLAAKAALATRVDAFGEDTSFTLGAEHKVKLEARLRLLEEGNLRKLSGTGKVKSQFEKYHVKTEVAQYPTQADSTLPSSSSKKRKHSEVDADATAATTPAPKKKLIEEIKSEETAAEPSSEKKKKKKKSKEVEEEAPAAVVEEAAPEETPGKKEKKKKKKNKTEDE